MLKIMMASPVGDALKTVRGDGNGSTKTVTARSPNYHLTSGNIQELLTNIETLQNVTWFRFTNINGKELLININHIAWIDSHKTFF